MSTYLKLCQDLVSELGLSGGTGPATVTGNTVGELNNVTRWIHDASLQIDNLWTDWKYLWQTYTQFGVSEGTPALPLPAPGVQLWDTNKFRWRPAGAAGQWQPFDYYTRQEYLGLYDPDNATEGPPGAFTINPDNTPFLSCPLDGSYDFKAEYWQRPFELIDDNDTPLMPSQHHRIIMCRAAVMYGNREDAPEVIAGLSAEYIDMLDKLQTDQLEGHALRRSSTDRERPAPNRGRLRDFLQ